MAKKLSLNLFDRIVAFISPGAGLRRLAARRELAKVEASAAASQPRSRPARRDESEGWRPMSESYERGDWKRWR